MAEKPLKPVNPVNRFVSPDPANTESATVVGPPPVVPVDGK